MKILYCSEPVNASRVYEYWKEEQEGPFHFAIIYAHQFYDVCRSLGSKGHIVSYHSDSVFMQDEGFTIEHSPIFLRNSSGLKYHLGQLLSGFSLVLKVIRLRNEDLIKAAFADRWVLTSTTLSHRQLPSPNPERSRRVVG